MHTLRTAPSLAQTGGRFPASRVYSMMPSAAHVEAEQRERVEDRLIELHPVGPARDRPGEQHELVGGVSRARVRFPRSQVLRPASASARASGSRPLVRVSQRCRLSTLASTDASGLLISGATRPARLPSEAEPLAVRQLRLYLGLGPRCRARPRRRASRSPSTRQPGRTWPPSGGAPRPRRPPCAPFAPPRANRTPLTCGTGPRSNRL